MKKNYLGLAIAALLISATSVAQTDTSKTKKLNTVIISADRFEKNPISVGRSVTVITQEELKQTTYHNLGEVLSEQAGISIIGTGQNPGNPQSVFMRGSNSNHTIILVDGMPLTDPSTTNQALDLSELSLSNIDRIEIMRGSHSTMYGSSAIGGVINIITKKNQKDGLNADLTIKGGTFGKETMQMNEDVFLNFSSKKGFYGNLEIMNEDINGLDATIDTITDPNAFKIHDNDDSRRLDMQGKIGYISKRWDISAGIKSFHSMADIDKSAYKDDDNYTLDFRRLLADYNVSFQPRHFSQLNPRSLTLKLNGGFSSLERYAKDDSSLVDNIGTFDHTFYDDRYKGKTISNEVLGKYKRNGFALVAGAGMLNETMTAQHYLYSSSMWGVYESKSDLDTLNINVNTLYGFFHADLNGQMLNKKLESFNLALGARYSRHELFGTNFTYEINPTIKLSDNSLMYLSYSTGYNAPSLYQLYTPEINLRSGILRSNINLKPETSNTFEVGFKQNFESKISFDISVFGSVTDNAIEYTYLWAKGKPADSLTFMDYAGDTYLNIGKLYNHGVELSIQSRISEKINLGGNISLVSGKMAYDPSLIDTAQTKGNTVQLYSSGDFITRSTEVFGLVRRPGTANVYINYKPVKSLLLKLSARFNGAKNDVYYNSELGPFGALGTKSVQDYTLLDFTAKYEITKALSAMLKIENIFDEKYVEIYGFTTRGRGIYVSLRYLITPKPRTKIYI